MSEVQEVKVEIGKYRDLNAYVQECRRREIFVGRNVTEPRKSPLFIPAIQSTILTLNIFPITYFESEEESPRYFEVVETALKNPALTYCPTEVGFALCLLPVEKLKEGNIYIGMRPLLPLAQQRNIAPSVGQIFVVQIEDDGRISLKLVAGSGIVHDKKDRIAFVKRNRDKKEGE